MGVWLKLYQGAIIRLRNRIWGSRCGSPKFPEVPQTTPFCPIHCAPNSILPPYYTAVHIPAEKKEAEYTMWHIAEIVEADKC